MTQDQFNKFCDEFEHRTGFGIAGKESFNGENATQIFRQNTAWLMDHTQEIFSRAERVLGKVEDFEDDEVGSDTAYLFLIFYLSFFYHCDDFSQLENTQRFSMQPLL